MALQRIISSLRTSHAGLPNVLVLVGPTASGKTEVSLRLAEELGAEIVSADSRQLYKYMDIGTAKPSKHERARVRHHLVDEFPPDSGVSAGDFGSLGRAAIADIVSRGKIPLVVGGSGLYVRSLIDGLFEGPGADEEFRRILEERWAAGEKADILAELERIDPVTAQSIDPTKSRRVIRALEVYHITGRPISEHHREHKFAIPFRPYFFGLDWDRKTLYARINVRCDEMISKGLLDEVEQLERMGYSHKLNALNTVGYREAFAYRRGEMGYTDMIRLFKQNSRRYAKRQLTWFRADARILWITMNETTSPADIAIPKVYAILSSVLLPL
jgi:tRNA dimethylallyltransferase